MTGNSFGKIVRLTTFGESHGIAIGGVLEGIPAGFSLNMDAIQKELDKRKPGQSSIVTQRKEADIVQFLSGIFEGKTLGTPIGFLIQNEDQKSKDYSHLEDVYRPSHADYTYQEKYGHRDYRGGGRSSARETACRVVAGAIAKQVLQAKGITIQAYVSQVGEVKTNLTYKDLDLAKTEDTIVRCPDPLVANQMIALIEETKKKGDTVGGQITGVIKGLPVGLGEPVFEKFHAVLGQAMLSINAVKGFEYGSGFDAVSSYGSTHNDIFEQKEDKLSTKTNFSGGVQGGITNGEDVYFNVAFKPVATILQEQNSMNNKGEQVVLKGKGRHDACVVPRATVIVEAMAALTCIDFYLRMQTSKI